MKKRKPINSAWIHNSYLGMATMMQRQAAIICESPTATDRSKELAQQIEQLAARLLKSLKEKVS